MSYNVVHENGLDLRTRKTRIPVGNLMRTRDAAPFDTMVQAFVAGAWRDYTGLHTDADARRIVLDPDEPIRAAKFYRDHPDFLECECYIATDHYEAAVIEQCDLCRAAPNLLAALEGLMWRFDPDDTDPHDCGKTAPDILAARAALAKATGQEATP